MSTVADPETLLQLIGRLEAVQPDSPRQWGTTTAAEMLCHVGDAFDSVLAPADPTRTYTNRRIMKWIALRSPLQWPRGLPTPSSVNPREDGTKPGDFDADRRRAIDGLRRFAAAGADQLASGHGAFGRMSLADWRRWAYRHTDHHLRQFAH